MEFVAPLHDVPRADFEFGPLVPGVPAVQALGSATEGLAAITILAAHTRGTDGPAFLIVRLRQGDPPSIVREKAFQAPRASRVQLVSVEFAPLTDRTATNLEIVLTAPSGGEVNLGATKNDAYPAGRLTYAGSQIYEDQDLSLRLYKRTTVWRLVDELRTQTPTGFIAAAVSGATALLLVAASIAKIALIATRLISRPAAPRR